MKITIKIQNNLERNSNLYVYEIQKVKKIHCYDEILFHIYSNVPNNKQAGSKQQI